MSRVGDAGGSMSAALIGGILLVALGIALEIIAQTIRRAAMRDPELTARAQEIAEIQAKSGELKVQLAKLQQSYAETIELIERLKNQIKLNDTRAQKVTRDYRVVVEHGVPQPRLKRYDGSAFNRHAGTMFTPASVPSMPSFWANECQIVIWAENLQEARGLFEKTYTPKDGFIAVFHGEIFGGRG